MIADRWKLNMIRRGKRVMIKTPEEIMDCKREMMKRERHIMRQNVEASILANTDGDLNITLVSFGAGQYTQETQDSIREELVASGWSVSVIMEPGGHQVWKISVATGPSA